MLSANLELREFPPFARVLLGGPDRNQYAAVNFGLMTVYQLIRDQTIRSQACSAVMLMIPRLEKDDWRIDDGCDNRTFVSPLLRAALLRGAATIDPIRYPPGYQNRRNSICDCPRRHCCTTRTTRPMCSPSPA
jgi:hypothetical protein